MLSEFLLISLREIVYDVSIKYPFFVIVYDFNSDFNLVVRLILLRIGHFRNLGQLGRHRKLNSMGSKRYKNQDNSPCEEVLK